MDNSAFLIELLKTVTRLVEVCNDKSDVKNIISNLDSQLEKKSELNGSDNTQKSDPENIALKEPSVFTTHEDDEQAQDIPDPIAKNDPDDANDKIEQLKQEKLKLEAAKSNLNAQICQQQERIFKLENDLEKARQDKADEISAINAKFKNALQDKDDQINGINAKFNESQNKISQLDNLLTEEKNYNKKLNDDLNAKKNELSGILDKLDILKKEFQNKDHEIDQLKKEFSKLRASNNNLQARIDMIPATDFDQMVNLGKNISACTNILNNLDVPTDSVISVVCKFGSLTSITQTMSSYIQGVINGKYGNSDQMNDIFRDLVAIYNSVFTQSNTQLTVIEVEDNANYDAQKYARPSGQTGSTVKKMLVPGLKNSQKILVKPLVDLH